MNLIFAHKIQNTEHMFSRFSFNEIKSSILFYSSQFYLEIWLNIFLNLSVSGCNSGLSLSHSSFFYLPISFSLSEDFTFCSNFEIYDRTGRTVHTASIYKTVLHVHAIHSSNIELSYSVEKITATDFPNSLRVLASSLSICDLCVNNN